MSPGAGRTLTFSLAGIAALGSLAMQLVVPSLPLMAEEFGTGAKAVQKVIGIYLVGLAIGQFIAGPMADRIGRRPILLGGMALFACGSICAAIAPNLPVLLIARLVQALGGACGIITARVLVGDLFPSEEAATRQATIMSVVLLSPAVAPVVGGALAQSLGWRAVFWLLAVAGLTVCLIARLRFHETRKAQGAPHHNLARAWRELFAIPRFTGHAIAVASGSAALYSFLAAAPFLLSREHGIGPQGTGLYLLLIAAASIVGTKFVARIDRSGYGALTGASITLSGALLLVLFAMAGWHSLMAVFVPMVLIGFGAGVLGPTGIAQIILSRPGLEGTASSLAGAIQMTASAIASSLIGAADTLRLGIVVLVLSLFGLASALYGRSPGKAAS